MVYEGLEAAKQLAGEGIDLMVVNLHTVKPLDQEAVLAAARKTGRVITAEEHQAAGGMGSAVAEYLSSACPVPVVRHGVADEFGRSGAAQKVLEAYALTTEGIVDKVRQAGSIKHALTL